MGADISIMKAIYQPFNHCIDVADDMTCQSHCCGDYNSCTCDTKNLRPTDSRQSDSTLTTLSRSAIDLATPAHSRQHSKDK